jgi:hypothetical protein
LPPHASAVGGLTQLVPLQQPAAQLAELQTQTLPTHACPGAHAAPPPHLHAPPLQESDFVGSHTAQVAPAVPHSAVVGGVVHAPLLQQPAAQLAAVHPLQDLALHVWVPGQAWQATPPVPQAPAWSPGWQPVALQQPEGQFAALQAQVPPTQLWPALHAALLPHLQVPPLQVSASVGSHAEQAAPAAPHLSALGVRHWLLSQQPLGQLAALQTHAPPTQACPWVQAEPASAPPPQRHEPATQRSVNRVAQVAQTVPPVPHAVLVGV